MRGEAWVRREHAVIALVAAGLIVVSPAAVGLTETVETSPVSQAENDPHPETDLLAPLLQLAQSSQERQALNAGYGQGVAWARAQLAQPADLPSAVGALYEAHDLDASPETEPVPPAFAGPLVALVTLQAHRAVQSGPYAELGTDASQAFTLGALTPVMDAFEQARHDAPEEPVFVDPLGLIVLGGSGDNAYDPRSHGPTQWKGPVLLVEPAGNDTYSVPVASPTTLKTNGLPQVRFQLSNLALEFGGNDTYRDRTASADLGVTTQAVLVDRHGNDTHGTTGIEKTTAHASPGFAYLLDEEGNDAYRAHSRGIAHSARAGKAILWDQQGNDTYTASQAIEAEFTHAVAQSREAKALLWDETGNDEYRAKDTAFGLAWNDGIARFLDEEGDDAYRVDNAIGSFGFRTRTLHSTIDERPLNRGLGEFIDGNGWDAYESNSGPGGDAAAANNHTHVDHRADRKWGVFIDCETPDDADRPCEDEQRYAHCTVLRNSGFVPAPVEPFVDPVLDDAKQACLEHGP